MELTKIKSLKGELCVPGDKSISHRAVMFASLAQGMTEISNFLQGADCLSTIRCFTQLGISITQTNSHLLVHGKGLEGLCESSSVLDVGNSGTTLRLLSGILAPQPFVSTLTGDASICKRPMKRIIDPLTQMGAHITSLASTQCAPLSISGSPLKGIHYQTPVASAQVKSAILLAGLYGEGTTSVTEPFRSRNHTEIMLHTFGASISSMDNTVTVTPRPQLVGQQIKVPGDISSAAYFIAAGLLVPNSELLIRNVGINPTRNGILNVVQAMGGKITLLNETHGVGEPVADLLVSSSSLKGITIEGSIIPTLIDEIPIIAIMASMAQGTTVIKDAKELKIKESDRISAIVENLKAMGVNVEGTEDGMIIHGGSSLKGAVIATHGDHRIAMSFAIAALLADGTTTIQDSDCVNISYPSFYEDLKKL